jgi:ribonuclease HI
MEHDEREATLKWVSDHAGIEGNEDADRLAGAAARLSSSLNCTVIIAAESR